MIGVTGFSHVTLSVRDLARSLAFYQGVLGMSLVHHGEHDAYLEWGTAWICVQETGVGTQQQPGLGVDHVAFHLPEEEFPLAVEQLRRAGVPIVRDPVLRGGGWTINFLDPDGICLELHTATLAIRMRTWR